jgi:hypothetical protein
MLLASLAFSAACSPSTGESVGASGSSDSTALTLSPVRDEVVVSCWLEPSADAPTAKCKGGASVGRLDKVTVTPVTTDTFSELSAQDAVADGTPAVVELGPASQLPLTLDVAVTFANDTFGESLGAHDTLHRNVVLDVAATKDAPLRVTSPFVLWPVVFVERNHGDFTYDAKPYEASTGAFTPPTAQGELVSKSISEDPNAESVRFSYLVAPASGAVAAKVGVDVDPTSITYSVAAQETIWRATATYRFSISAPTIFIVTRTGIRPATADDVLPKSVTAMQSAPDAGAPAADAGQPSTADSGTANSGSASNADAGSADPGDAGSGAFGDPGLFDGSSSNGF